MQVFPEHSWFHHGVVNGETSLAAIRRCEGDDYMLTRTSTHMNGGSIRQIELAGNELLFSVEVCTGITMPNEKAVPVPPRPIKFIGRTRDPQAITAVREFCQGLGKGDSLSDEQAQRLGELMKYVRDIAGVEPEGSGVQISRGNSR